jgi:peptidoglycan/LPS O-acetylase OafA/YrhL
LNYRSDIDGLRTIAVFLVILNHAGFSIFAGGFVGVDVFFVISGFLITTIIYSALQQNKFSMAWFLGRRIKRLMPVLLFILLITTIVFSFIMLPQDLMKYYRSIIWVVSYVGNFFFWREHGGYFDGGSAEVPLLHTWSLAVEEQYYFIWPLMLMVAYRYLGRKGTIAFSVVGCIAATIFSQWGTEVTIGAAYYLLPTRFFELLVGSCLALGWVYLPKPNQFISHFFSLLGLTLIIGSALLLNEHSAFPGYNALYPVIGTALIIYSSNGIVNKLLSYRPMVYTGNISYSLYLWHWPILVLFRYTAIELTLFNQIFAISLTYILSVLSYKYIEQPCRHLKAVRFKPIGLHYYAIPSAALIIIALVGINFDGYQQRFPKEIIQMEVALNSHTSDSRSLCHSPYRESEKLPNNTCVFGDNTQEKSNTDIFVFGDSHANHLVPFIEVLAKNSKVSAQDYTLDRCLPIFDLKWGSNLHKAGLCKNRNELALNHIQSNSFSYVVLAASWPDIATRRIFTDERVDNDKLKIQLFNTQFNYTLQRIVEAGAIPIVITDTPSLNGKSPKCTIKKNIFNNKLNCDIQRQENVLITQTLTTLKETFTELIIIEPHKIMCIANDCKMEIDGIPLYRDDDHLNEQGSALLGTLFLKKSGSPFHSANTENLNSGEGDLKTIANVASVNR